MRWKWIDRYDSFKQVPVYCLMEDWEHCLAEVSKDPRFQVYYVHFPEYGTYSRRRFRRLAEAKRYAQEVCEVRML